MMLSSKFILFQISIVVLLMMTFTMTNIAPPPTSFIDEISQIEDDESNPLAHSSSADTFSDEDYHKYYLKTLWPQLLSKRFSTKVIRGGMTTNGDNRLWAIPYRFGKRSAMPYRFGKRDTGMHFRLGKKNLL